MNVLVTGAGGQLATELIRRAPGAAEVEALDIEQLDVTSSSRVRDCLESIRPAVVFNAAAWTDVDGAEANEDEALAVNRDGAAHLADACGEQGIRMVHVSTDFVFDGTSTRPCRIDDPTSPLGAYGRTKLAGEAAVLDRLGDAGLVVRTAWLYAAHGRNFLRTMLNVMSQRDHLKVVADQRGTPTSAASLATALWDLVAAGASGIHHWTDGGETTWHEFAVCIRDTGRAEGLLDHDVTIEAISTSDWPTPATRPAYSVLDTSVTEALLGRSPRPWSEEVRDVIGELAAAAAGESGA
ncbi:MAG: dTDP-4-dehydrorhamnose reductase [Phycisphaerales bacterium]|nr:dTDP-4-dehydrorhamnose reductase [Phycisphaerales bacterium]